MRAVMVTALLAAAGPAAAQLGPTVLETGTAVGSVLPASLAVDPRGVDGDALLPAAPLDGDAPYVLIRLAENRLYLMQGERALWHAPVATGTGFRLEGAGQRWTFDTPRGAFRIRRKEKDPVWIMPDWAFVEAGLPVPPADSPRRRRRGALGTTALYIEYDLAIHGTEQPELVLHPDPDERRVSHGCIRMTNEDARTLYHLVDVGTPVFIY